MRNPVGEMNAMAGMVAGLMAPLAASLIPPRQVGGGYSAADVAGVIEEANRRITKLKRELKDARRRPVNASARQQAMLEELADQDAYIERLEAAVLTLSTKLDEVNGGGNTPANEDRNAPRKRDGNNGGGFRP